MFFFVLCIFIWSQCIDKSSYVCQKMSLLCFAFIQMSSSSNQTYWFCIFVLSILTVFLRCNSWGVMLFGKILIIEFNILPLILEPVKYLCSCTEITVKMSLLVPSTDRYLEYISMQSLNLNQLNLCGIVSTV